MLLLAGCESSTAPGKRIQVRVDSVGAPVAELDPSGQLLMMCPVHLTVLNPGVAAHWYMGSLRYFPGGDTTIHVDSLALSAPDIAAIWGGSASDLAVPGGVAGIWDAAAPAPFYGIASFMSQANGDQVGYGTTSVRFSCGVSTVGARPDAASPVITTLSVVGSDTVSAATVVRFSVTLAASNGLWTARFHDITSACIWDYDLAWTAEPKTYSSTDGSVAMWVPGCPAGPRAITLTVRDAFLHATVDTITVYVR